MSDIWKALPYYLKNNTALAALISDRVYPMRLPETTTLPAITYQDISLAVVQAHKEKSALPMPRFQFTIYGGSIDKTNQVAQALKDALDGFRGSMGTGAYTTQIQACLLKNEITIDDPQISNVYQKIQDYLIRYK